MSLQSPLFHGEPKLEATAISDAAHIVPGARGEHVRRIQLALIRLDGATIEADGIYGPATAAAVLAFKKKRNIVNRGYQTKADNIVGKMTIAALDEELLKQAENGELQITVYGDKPRLYATAHSRHPAFRLAFGFDAGFLDAGIGMPRVSQFSITSTRWSPGVTGTIRFHNIAGYISAVCVNEPDFNFDPPKAMRRKVAFISDRNDPPLQDRFSSPSDGGRVFLTEDPQNVRLQAFQPGNARITVAGLNAVHVLVIEIRQEKKGAVKGALLTKPTAKSKFFSATREEDHEDDPLGVIGGRPVNPKLGGKLINLGGEGETPGFEDYQVDFIHSEDARGNFRPWTEDPDPSVFIPNRSASHITMRGTPLTDTFIKVIKRIAQPRCRFTFSGAPSFAGTLRSSIPGHQLEEPFLQSDHINIAWEIT